MATEAHIQGIARFLVGFGTEEDEYWRDYHFDFCGHIDYDPHTGVPQNVHPVESSGYSVGCLQLDFGQITAAAEPFITAFEQWQKSTPGAAALVSTHAFAVDALKSDGQTLNAHPGSALRRQDVEALSAFVLSAGSDWVNTNIDNALIGGDTQTGPAGRKGLHSEQAVRSRYRRHQGCGRDRARDARSHGQEQDRLCVRYGEQCVSMEQRSLECDRDRKDQ